MRAYIRRHAIFEPGPAVVACSGGPDSVALVGILHALSRELGLVLHVAHFDHRMRATSARDAQVVERLARGLGLPLHVGAAARRPRGEAEARDARYRFLRGVAVQTGARVIALGHTRDDQAETVLLHLVRGSGVAGLAAMRPRRDDLARPLLALTRAETEAYSKAMGVRAARDPTNRDLRFARNLVRLRVLPALERINPQVREALSRLADHAAALSDALRERAGRALADATRETGAGWSVLDLAALPDDDASRSEALALAAERAGVPMLSDRHRRALLDLSREREGSAQLDLPSGRVAAREYATLRLGPPGRSPPPEAPVGLAAGERVRWGGWTFALDDGATRVSDLPQRGRVGSADGLLVRAWRPGDRLAAVRGRSGRKVQDVLTDAKVPRRIRAGYPVVVDPTGAVVWVPGLAGARLGEEGTPVEVRARPPDTASA